MNALVNLSCSDEIESPHSVMPALVAGIHVCPLPTLPRVRGRVGRGQAWMAGTSPAMTP